MKMPTSIPKEPLIFSAGLAVGSLITWLLVKNKYETMAKEEIDSVKNIYARINQTAIEKAAAAKNKPDIMTYTQSVTSDAETKPEESQEEEEPVEEDYEDEPIIEKVMYEIEPAEFASYDNYNTKITILYFDDDVYADERYDQLNPRDYFSKKLVLIGGKEPVDTIDYIRRMDKDEICIRDVELGLDIDIYTQGRSYTDYMST